MNNISNIYGNKSFNLEILNKDIKKLEDLLLNHRIYENTCFITWDKDFKTIYSNKHITTRLYTIFACYSDSSNYDKDSSPMEAQKSYKGFQSSHPGFSKGEH